MLSIENPPLDPPFPCQLKSGSDDIEKAPHKLPLPEVDLLKQPPLDENHHTPPKFSIRDYVFSARSKDIKKNWPFSLKNLQLCLKHGVKDPLPPFQHLDTVNPSLIRCTDETTLAEEHNTSKFDGEPYGSNHHVLLESYNDSQSSHLAVNYIENSSCRSGGENENDFPSTNSVSQFEIESVPINNPSKSLLETDNSVEASAEVQAIIPFKPPTTENTIRSSGSGKKCRLIAKFGANSDHSLTEDIASNCTMVSESMASKVCPVCKTFSSSSNTTLNAHIDQCLSVESTPKWTADSKITRHRIKPRKTRFMVDVYATAKHCTLEELDRRNGTNWALVSSLLVQNSEKLEASNEGKKQIRISPVHPEDDADVGSVYIDADGTKVRILSKFNEATPISKVGEDLERKKSLKGVKGSKFFSSKKKRRHALKHLRYLKQPTQSRKTFSGKANALKVVGDPEGYCALEGSFKDEECWIHNQTNSSGSGNLGKQVCCKRTSLARKAKCQDIHQPLFCKWHVSQDLPAQSDISGFGDHVVKRNGVHKFKNLSENLFSSPDICEGTEKPLYESRAIDRGEHSPGRKRVRSPLIGAKSAIKVKRSSPAVKQNTNQMNKDGHYAHEGPVLRPPKSTANHASSLSHKAVGIDATSDPDSHLYSSPRPAFSACGFPSKVIGFPTWKKNSLPISSRSLVVDSTSKKSQLHSPAENEMDEEPQAWDCEVEQRQRKSVSAYRRDETMALKSSELASCYSDHDSGDNADSSVRTDGDILGKVDGLESAEEMVTSPSKSSETKFHKLGDPSKSRSSCLQTLEEYNRSLSGEEVLPDTIGASFIDGQEIFSADEVGLDMIENATMAMGAELMDSEAAQGGSFPEVDPIPIPGPPGSFLPSPRGISSDDFPGNSSLTTSRVQSSQDHFDLVDGDSSDSPISAASTISDPMAARSDLRYSESLTSVGAPAVEEMNKTGLSGTNMEPSMENAVVVTQTSTVPERNFDGEKNKIHRIFVEKRPFIFKNDDQPCCCQRKEKSSQGVALNYHQSPPIKRRAMASLKMPAMEMPIGVGPNNRPNNLDVSPEAFSLSSSTSSGPQKLVLPASPTARKRCMDAGVKYSGRANCDSASPSSNPVLRLMGKNLMVVNKEEDPSVPVGQAQLCGPSNCLISQFPTSGICQGIICNQVCQSFHPIQDSSTFGQHPHSMVGASNSYGYHAPVGTSQKPQIPVVMFQDQCVEQGFTSSMEPYTFKSNYNSPTRQNRPKAKLVLPSPSATDKVSTLDCQQRCAESTASVKEIIVLDDAQESETSMTADIAKHYEGLRGSQVMLRGISTPIVTGYGLRHAHPFSCYRSEEYPFFGQPQVGPNTNVHSVLSGQANTSPIRWGCTTSEGSRVLHGTPFVAPLSSAGHLRRSLYYSPSLS
ncbi:hypothetical protein SLE2022_020520 [Rubroshorea leprosula]